MFTFHVHQFFHLRTTCDVFFHNIFTKEHDVSAPLTPRPENNRVFLSLSLISFVFRQTSPLAYYSGSLGFVAKAPIKSQRALRFQLKTAGATLVGDSVHQLRPPMVMV